MQARLVALWQALRASFWFIPMLMAAIAAVLSVVMVSVDRWLGTEWMEALSWTHANDPDGARLLLSTIAGSMIGVAGVTFSITIAAVAFASGQFGPRILHNFMRDRVNQVTLGTFVATFLYCLLVLRTIRSIGLEQWVPNMSVLVGVGFAVASIGVLIQFIHHIADSIYSSTAMANIGAELQHAIHHLYPENGDVDESVTDDGAGAVDASARAALPIAFARHAFAVPASSRGYVQALSENTLVETAMRHDVIIRVVRRPGDFAVPGRPIAYVWPPDKMNDVLAAAIQTCFAYGRRRTTHQDVRLLLDQLVDMAGRALSPGINDSQTAIGCLNWLGAGLSDVARRAPRPDTMLDDAGDVRVVMHLPDFGDLTESVLGRLRPYFETDRNAAFAMMRTISDVMLDADRDGDRATLVKHASKLAEGAAKRLSLQSDVEDLRRRLDDIRSLLGREPGQIRLSDIPEWMQGSG